MSQDSIRAFPGGERRRRRFLPALALAALAALAACGSGAPDEGKWSAGHGPDFCQAGRQSPTREFWIMLRRPAYNSALSVRGPDFAGVAEGSNQSGYTLTIDGTPVRAEVFGTVDRGKPGLDFLFNPRPLLRRHPAGFEAVIARDGREIYRVKVAGPDAVKAIEETLACDRELRFTGRVDPYKS
ncbi:MAG: hypothetical protein ABWX67_12220 [Allosphingosinicella sp.]